MKPLLSNDIRKLCSYTGVPLFSVPLCIYSPITDYYTETQLENGGLLEELVTHCIWPP